MLTRDICKTCFDEDIQTDIKASQCPECGGHVTMDIKKTVCKECGLMIEERRLDHGPEWQDTMRTSGNG